MTPRSRQLVADARKLARARDLVAAAAAYWVAGDSLLEEGDELAYEARRRARIFQRAAALAKRHNVNPWHALKIEGVERARGARYIGEIAGAEGGEWPDDEGGVVLQKRGQPPHLEWIVPDKYELQRGEEPIEFQIYEIDLLPNDGWTDYDLADVAAESGQTERALRKAARSRNPMMLAYLAQAIAERVGWRELDAHGPLELNRAQIARRYGLRP